MIIDFHTHTFPDKIAESSIKVLEENSDTLGYTDGTNRGLMESMKRAGIDMSVILPVVTNPEKTSHINKFAAEVNETTAETGLISFGGIHPDSENYKDLIRECKELGLKGIKLHPDYYGVMFNDIRIKRIVSYASEMGLIVLTHAGMDIGLYPPLCCSIDSILEVIREVSPEKLVLAHMGGWMNWEEVTERLAGENVWLDTAFSLGEINWRDKSNHKPYHMLSDEMFVKMVRAFGSDRVLFATDCPWADQKNYVNHILNAGLTDEERENIFHNNAERLLGL
jgi:Predicted metal-dependent hydrolase of the TIM-barrel fold